VTRLVFKVKQIGTDFGKLAAQSEFVSMDASGHAKLFGGSKRPDEAKNQADRARRQEQACTSQDRDYTGCTMSFEAFQLAINGR
jgi:hypothetical protein